ncbi:MAG TPA: immunoglobulin domain-containing protein [Verrucomicrobiae bacterium]|jgi:hypothetical protein
MKKLIVLLSSCLAGLPVVAQLAVGNPEYEPFSDATASGGTTYTVGAYLSGQSRAANPGDGVQSWWEYGPTVAANSNNVATNQPIIVTNDLPVPGLYSDGGGRSVAFGGNGDSAVMNLTTSANGITAGTVYFSFAFKLTDLTQLTTNGTYFAGFNNLQSHDHAITTPAAVATRVMVRSTVGGFNVGLQEGGGNPTTGFNTAWGSTVFTLSDTIFVVGSYTFNSGAANNDVAQLWINPGSSTFGNGSAPAPDLTSSGASADIARIASFTLLNQSAAEPPGLLDDLRIGLSWADVTPSSDYLIITQNPVNQTLPDGYTATFSVVAKGAAPLTYQWIKGGSTFLANGGNISGANSNVLTISNISPGDVTSYAAYVTNGTGTVLLSSSATLTLSDPSVIGQPQSRTNKYGTTATFSVTPSGTGPFTYQWQKDGNNLTDGGYIFGSYSNLLVLTNVAAADTGGYSVIITNALGATIQSLTANLTVIDPIIVTQPVNATNVAGNTISFHVVAAGTPTLSYQWYKNGSGFLFDNGHISGSQSDTLTISSISAADVVNYSCQVYGVNFNNVTSSVVTIVLTSPLTITAPPNPRTVTPGDPAVFAIGTSGSGALNYQWFFNNNPVNGATNFAYALTNAQTANVGNYFVIASNSFNAVTSAPVALTLTTNLSLTTNDLVVIRCGNGAEGLTLDGNSMFLDAYATDGSYLNTVTIPDSGSTATVAIGMDNIGGANSGATTGSGLTLSLDGRFLVIAGYNTNLNYGDNLANSVAATVPRGIGLINSHGQFKLAVASTNPAFDQTYWRAAITDGTNNYWGSGGKTGVVYFGFDGPAATVQNTFVNSRSMQLINGDIYCAEASNPTGILKVNGMPTNAANATTAVLFGGSSGTFDMSVSPSGNLIYVADQRATTAGGGLQRWEFDGTAWNLIYTLTNGLGSMGPRYITADFSGANPVIYLTSNDKTLDNNRIVQIADTGAGSAGVTLAYAGVNQTFRSIHFGPVESPFVVTSPILSFTHESTNLILNWDGAFTLQSAADVTGPYTDVPSATSPYTNSVSVASQLFFRLRN